MAEEKEAQHNPVLEALKVEMTQLDAEATPYVHSVIDHEIRKLSQESTMKGPPPNQEYIELNEKSRVKLMHKIYVPVDRFPGFNFVGKILGNKGENLKKIALETKTRIAILGQGSAKKNTNVQELIESGDPAHMHLKEPLHVRVESYGGCQHVWANMAKAMEALMPFMTPDESYQPPQPMYGGYGGAYDPYAYGGGYDQGYPPAPGFGGRGMRGRGRGDAPPFRGRGRGAPRGRGGFGGENGGGGANGFEEEMDTGFGEGYQQAPAFGKSRPAGRGGPRGRGMPGGRGDGRGRGRPGRGRPY